jgi:hypothetical protein
MLTRRRFVGTLSSALLAAPRAVQAQTPGKVYRIGVLEVVPIAFILLGHSHTIRCRQI